MKPSTWTAYAVYIQNIHKQEKIVKIENFTIQKKNIKKHYGKQSNHCIFNRTGVLDSNSNLIIPKSLQPDDVHLR